MHNTKLFDSYPLTDITLSNRFVMAPMTRSRSDQPGDIPNELMADYYAQRTSAGLIITEATYVSRQGQGYARTPGICTAEQIEGWKKTTRAVHARGGKIFLQLWHTGRIGSSKVNDLQPIAPSALAPGNTSVYIFDGPPNGDVTFVPVELPRAMTAGDIETVKQEFTQAARNAIEAGFDGIELHAANGYLFDQFLRTTSNKRTDMYGGSKENRIRLLMEITKGVAEAIGKEKTSVRLSPFIKIKDMDDPEIVDTILLAAGALNTLDIAYIHLCETDWEDAPVVPLPFREMLRQTFSNTIIATGSKTPEEGALLLEQGLIDLVGFGRKFVANPDYPERVKRNAALNEISDSHTLFGGGSARGYTDYPFLP